MGERLRFDNVEQHEPGSMRRGQLDRPGQHYITCRLQIESSQIIFIFEALLKS